MDRRAALKHISLAFGSVVATSTLLNIVASCTKEDNTNAYLFLNENQVLIINHLSSIILPEHDSDNKKIMDYSRFTDKMLFHTVSDETKKIFNLGSDIFIQKFKKNTNKSIPEGTINDFKNQLKKYFDISKAEEEKIFDLLTKPFASIENKKKSDFLNYYFLTKVRSFCLFGHCTSKYFQDLRIL